MPLQVENFRASVKNTLRGYFSVRWPEAGDLIVRDFALHLSSGRWWIAYPSREYVDRRGEKKRWNFVAFPTRGAAVDFQEAVFAALRIAVPETFAETGGPGSARHVEDGGPMGSVAYTPAAKDIAVKMWPLDPDEPDDGVTL